MRSHPESPRRIHFLSSVRGLADGAAIGPCVSADPPISVPACSYRWRALYTTCSTRSLLIVGDGTKPAGGAKGRKGERRPTRPSAQHR